MWTKSLLLVRQAAKPAVARQSVRHGSYNLREIAVKYNNDLCSVPVPQGSHKADFKARDFKLNWQIGVLIALNLGLYKFYGTYYPGTDARGRLSTYKIDPPVYNTSDKYGHVDEPDESYVSVFGDVENYSYKA
ncbi:uncharacterized protein LOC132558300 [Ylistrum balloti]|uniref:uncharacterized protein LOC132558300 n=1 Tax=Ylistrum balloti TaxID=509963 RepID=UPI0029058526|nr:uncharacterized protein LOC132558300 [Ylistrum balloti]